MSPVPTEVKEKTAVICTNMLDETTSEKSEEELKCIENKCTEKETSSADTEEDSEASSSGINRENDKKDSTGEGIDTNSDEPSAKRAKTNEKSPVPEDPEIEVLSVVKVPEKKVTPMNRDVLLDRLEEYVENALESGVSVERKLLDALLGAINIEVQREPLSLRKLILDKQLVLPNTISFPPSQVVDVIIEHDPEVSLSKVINKMFGNERPKLTEAEKRDRRVLKMNHPAPHMSKLLMDIGQDLVQESTYSDIVHAKNLPETPKNIETYQKVVEQLKPVWEALVKKNEPYKLKQYNCQFCSFASDSRLVVACHKQTPHFDGRKYQCGLCPEYFTNENMIEEHYRKRHELAPAKQETLPHNPCPCCEEEFVYKGQRDQHLRTCRKEYKRLKIMSPKDPEDVSAINQWLWEKPPVDPTILQQQQIAQRQIVERQRREQLAKQQAAEARRKAAQKSALFAAQQHQAMLFQQRMRAAQAAVLGAQSSARMNPLLNNANLLAAMQQQLRQLAAAGIRAPCSPARFRNSLQNNSSNHISPQLQTNGSAPSSSFTSGALPLSSNANICEICDQNVQDKNRYLNHLKFLHSQMRGKSILDMQQVRYYTS
ncbi:hypothetical protein AB6A40_008076 [Gnathostoma spinigerum]|uniref:C2H2-type domain-containing protein n=1 Tax=Gnathostoma spinigerum TaxID=75299 RepID=A0ABD6EXP7_9BILA